MVKCAFCDKDVGWGVGISNSYCDKCILIKNLISVYQDDISDTLSNIFIKKKSGVSAKVKEDCEAKKNELDKVIEDQKTE